MIKIIFLRSEKAYLPEIDAYIEYFNKTPEYVAYDSSKLDFNFNLEEFDVIWEFKGVGGTKSKNQFVIHEYASLSTGFLPRSKDFVKSIINPKPDLRVFLNETVNKEMGFKDGIEYCYRDMGIDQCFLKARSDKKDYEFVYIGSMEKSRGIDRLLKAFTRNCSGRLCLIGNPPSDLYNEFKGNNNIVFTGKVPYKDVPEIASKAVYGINCMPDKYPYNLQTSTKVLEYLALGLKVITTDYKWIRDFEKLHSCDFYKISIDEFNTDSLDKFNFKSNYIPENYTWDLIIENSRLRDKITMGTNGKF